MEIKGLSDRIVKNIGTVIKGKDDVIQKVVVCLLCGGHILLEDVPGTGKTTLAKSLARSLDCSFKRVQFTPDLLPSDLTGVNFYHQKSGEFQFKKGALFTNILLGDEINRATPRTQSSLLEAMEERQISVDGVTTRLSEPFIVMATQNPIESYGTFPLPEAQIDRFFMRLSLGYMQREEELAVISRPPTTEILSELEQVVTPDEIEQLKKDARLVAVSPDVAGYLMDIVQKTRTESRFVTGVSTRGAIAFYRACQVWAALQGRDYVVPEDVQRMAEPVLCHRIVSGGSVREGDKQTFLRRLIDEIPVPLETLPR